jgi:hypothetical protein
MTHFERIVQEIEGKRQIDFARIFRAAARMQDSGKARNLINVVAAAASKKVPPRASQRRGRTAGSKSATAPAAIRAGPRNIMN